ncbi:hypothetical protein [Metapseudomonas resinovorans]|uniref:DUF429 domain-containing protein n=1 Tax=Metapseudomonas resinovorans NBRC 106553 TaxID=1245471 RepID=S6AGE0_METRE|nr:hypothetical protein [Pseudomonas resinovorans]BAN49352.1 hypothetical protein PCA10_36200 [Pseudomonas resinovorans NBRC 106553]
MSNGKSWAGPWRGNLRRPINQAVDSTDFVARLLSVCEVDPESVATAPVVLAIDTPLAFSSAFIELLVQGRAVTSIEGSASNPYLFRHTERFLFERGISPLSAVKDMIGSQATKGIHVLARFAPHIEACGIWSDLGRLRAIEAYPSACKKSSTMATLQREYPEIGALEHADQRDALTCALLAWLFHYRPGDLAQPGPEAPLREGWIFVPADALP